MNPLFTRSRLAVAAVAVLVVAGMATWIAHRGSSESSTDVHAQASAGKDSKLSFSDRTLAFGIQVPHRQGDDHLTGLDEALGSGACALDYDKDGWIDLFLVNGSGDTRYYGRRHWWQRSAGHRLLRNREGRQFEDVTDAALQAHPTRGFGCVTADLDNDGNTDVFVAGIDENLLLRNLGNGRFLNVTEQAAVKGHGWQTAATVADVDGDGLLDLYVGRFIEFQKGAHTYEPGSQYKQDVPASFNSALYPAQAKSLYRNLGGFRFEDVAEQAGVSNSEGRTLGALWLDLDEDHRPDLLVANAAGTGSTAVFRNTGKWKFTALSTETRLQTAAGARSLSLGDIDNDGVAEIFFTAPNGAQSGIFVRQDTAGFASSTFIDRGRPWNFTKDEYSGFSPWSVVTADFDNDGWLDAFVANGLTTPDSDVPRLTVGQPKQLWLNSGRGSLIAQAFAKTSPFLDRQSARGAVTADFDNDGDVDLYVTHNNDLGQLLINESAPRHWVGLQLVDGEGNRDAVGSKIEVRTDRGKYYRWLTRSAGFLSGSDPRVHVGIGSSEKISRVVVTWPDGERSTYRNVPIDSYVKLERDESAVALNHTVPVTAQQAKYKSLAQGSEAALRADYLRLLVAARGHSASIPEIRAALADPDATVRKSLIELLDANQSAESLTVLLDLLSDTDPEVVQMAVKPVCRYEEEAAARWMLRLFSHPSAPIRAAAADCFAFYFHEEEAVVHRKYLAVPYLIGLLEDPDESVQIAAARALGNGERFRGVPPLLELAKETSSSVVRTESIRAVGLIRDKHAIADLIALLADKRLQSEPTTVAHLIIALKRLDHAPLPVIMSDFGAGRGQFAAMSMRARLSAMQELLQSPDGVVIARDTVTALARRSYETTRPTDEATVLALVEILAAGDRASMLLLGSLAKAGSTAAIKAASLHALMAIDPAKAGTYLESAITADNAEIAGRLLQKMSGKHVELSDQALVAGLARDDIRQSTLQVVRRLRNRTSADAVFRIAADSSATPQLRAAALGALSRSAFRFDLPREMYVSKDESVALAVLRYEVSKLPPLLVSREAPPIFDKLLAMPPKAARLATIDALAQREEFWAKAKILELLHKGKDVAIREHILELMTRDAIEGSRVLEAIATDKSDPLRIEALRHLEGREGSSAEQLLAGILHDASDDPHARIVAAHRLVGRLGVEVLEILEKS